MIAELRLAPFPSTHLRVFKQGQRTQVAFKCGTVHAKPAHSHQASPLTMTIEREETKLEVREYCEEGFCNWD